jgi:hypothetical protein
MKKGKNSAHVYLRSFSYRIKKEHLPDFPKSRTFFSFGAMASPSHNPTTSVKKSHVIIVVNIHNHLVGRLYDLLQQPRH